MLSANCQFFAPAWFWHKGAISKFIIHLLVPKSPTMDRAWMAPLVNGWCNIHDEENIAVWKYHHKASSRPDEWLIMRKNPEFQDPEFTVGGDVGFIRRTTKCLQEN